MGQRYGTYVCLYMLSLCVWVVVVVAMKQKRDSERALVRAHARIVVFIEFVLVLAVADKKKFGYKMLQKMGWTEGKGLGKHEHGMKTHVKIDPKTTREGIGAENDATGNNTLSKGFHEFNSFLTTLSSHYATVQDDNKDSQKKKKKKKDKSELVLS